MLASTPFCKGVVRYLSQCHSFRDKFVVQYLLFETFPTVQVLPLEGAIIYTRKNGVTGTK